jgi:hypothetical protein
MPAIEEAVETYRPLAHANPAVFGADLAVSLRNLAEAGREEEAREAHQAAVTRPSEHPST